MKELRHLSMHKSLLSTYSVTKYIATLNYWITYHCTTYGRPWGRSLVPLMKRQQVHCSES